jgi:hypothetical protein
MNELAINVQEYLRQSDEIDAANFLNDCIIEEYFFTDAVSEGEEVFVYNITILMPVRRFKKRGISTISIETKIESAARDYVRAFGKLYDRISWKSYLKDVDQDRLDAKAIDIVLLLNDNEYVASKFKILTSNIEIAPHVAIGTAKELVETCCKAILKHFNVIPENDWTLSRLVKETNNVLVFSGTVGDEGFVSSIKMVLNGLGNVVHGLSAIRNQYGSGHGHEPDFKELDKAYTHLVVYSSIELITFYLRVFNSQKSKS